jgi:hypothetical protein
VPSSSRLRTCNRSSAISVTDFPPRDGWNWARHIESNFTLEVLGLILAKLDRETGDRIDTS